MKRTNAKKRVLRKTYIKEWRDHARLSQEALADRLGISHSTLGRIERGISPYKQAFLEALAEELKCSPADLLMRDPSDPEGIWSVWDNLTAPQRRQAVEMIHVLKRTGTSD